MENPSHIKKLISQPGIWFMLGAFILALHPLQWLVNTWFDPAYDSNGLWIFLLVIGIFIWSWRSPRRGEGKQIHAISLLITSSLLRLVGQLLAVNSIAALTLVVDVYALALLAGLHQRKNVISPAWLAVLFALSLPFERILQRSIGYGLQEISAWGACKGLSVFTHDVTCAGVRIILAGQDVLVDLPCSGARGLMLLLLSFVLLASIKRPNWLLSMIGLVIVLVSAAFCNAGRIMLLAYGIAYPDRVGGIDVMSEPWHDVIGYGALFLGLIPILVWAQRIPQLRLRPQAIQTAKTLRLFRKPMMLPIGILFCAFTLLILQAPATPLDVAHPGELPHLPSQMLGMVGTADTLSKKEQAYFQQFGGGAQRSFYGNNALLVVNTSAPLRHLHTPDECLRGSGHDVQYLGLDNSTIPTAIYRSIDPQGQAWRVRVSFVSDNSLYSHSVSGAVWQWLQNPTSHWTQIQRVTPWTLDPQAADQFDKAVLAALDIPAHPMIASAQPM